MKSLFRGPSLSQGPSVFLSGPAPCSKATDLHTGARPPFSAPCILSYSFHTHPFFALHNHPLQTKSKSPSATRFEKPLAQKGFEMLEGVDVLKDLPSGRVELPTFGLGNRCSIQLSYEDMRENFPEKP